MTLQMSRRGKQYIETAQSLLRAARSMTDEVVAARLKMLAEDYQRRAEKASSVDAARSLARSAARAEYDWSKELA
ncbi:hypothetical protein CWO91_24855 [Bradyrhizobium genosp. SA-3]|uniref:Uncharacterized protein n=1 Tax=Bradyrhizobium zhanjiangense TaxID=1325107 RepID=A0A4Q0QEZ1_9BRAD|nr:MULTISPECIES: hypothetical protein [Bradyrhizobium]RXG88957.1 hypothetical protein EAS61_28425 [Bradyrhizobium zhanjiangense]RZN07965.1 hypothetical protein CWO91_24855 [Bradyrhizobium genosp. SA-3]